MTKPTGDIHKRMVWLMNHLPTIAKQQVQAGSGGSYKAFAIDDIYNEFHPKFAEAGVYITPRLQSVEYIDDRDEKGKGPIDARVIVEYTFHAEDGTSVSMVCAAEGRDWQDKATNKAVQQAFKYGLVQTFLQATGEPDPDQVPTQDEKPPADSPHQKAWAVVYELFPDDPQVMWAALFEKMGHRRGHQLNTKEAKELVAAAKELREEADEDNDDPGSGYG